MLLLIGLSLMFIVLVLLFLVQGVPFVLLFFLVLQSHLEVFFWTLVLTLLIVSMEISEFSWGAFLTDWELLFLCRSRKCHMSGLWWISRNLFGWGNQTRLPKKNMLPSTKAWQMTGKSIWLSSIFLLKARLLTPPSWTEEPQSFTIFTIPLLALILTSNNVLVSTEKRLYLWNYSGFCAIF